MLEIADRWRRPVIGIVAAVVALIALVASATAGAQIIYVSNKPYCDVRGCVDSRGLWVMNDDGSNAHPWLSELQVRDGEGGLTNPYASPDGQTVVFDGQWGSANAIWSTGIYRWSAGAVTRLSPTPFFNSDTSTGALSTVHADDPEIGADGNVYFELRFTMLGTLWASHGQVWSQDINDVGGTGANAGVCQNVLGFGGQVTADTYIGDPAANPIYPGVFAYTGCYQITGPSVSNDWLVLYQPQNQPREGTIYTEPQNGDRLFDPSWSPDASSIVFVRDDHTTQHQLLVATFNGSSWSQRVVYTGKNALAGPRFAGSGRIVFTESNVFPDGNPCDDCGIGIRSVPSSCSNCTEANSVILAQNSYGDDLEPAWMSGALPPTALPGGLPRDKYMLGISRVGSGSGTVTGGPIKCPATCTASIARGTTVVLHARPASGSRFAGWSGSGCSGTGSCQVMLDADRTVTAKFSANPPDTRIASRRINSRLHTAAFKFRGVGIFGSFQCALARKPARGGPRYGRCRSPRTYKNLRAGSYTFYVRAIGSGGTDRTPAKAAFKIG